MIIEIKIPWIGIEGTELKTYMKEWNFSTNDFVNENDIIVSIENEFGIMEIPAEKSGRLNILKNQEEEVQVGDIICTIEFDE